MNQLNILTFFTLLFTAGAATAAWRSAFLVKEQTDVNNLNSIFMKIMDLESSYLLKFGSKVKSDDIANGYFNLLFNYYEYLATLVIKKKINENDVKELFFDRLKSDLQKIERKVFIFNIRKEQPSSYSNLFLLLEKWGYEYDGFK